MKKVIPWALAVQTSHFRNARWFLAEGQHEGQSIKKNRWCKMNTLYYWFVVEPLDDQHSIGNYRHFHRFHR